MRERFQFGITHDVKTGKVSLHLVQGGVGVTIVFDDVEGVKEFVDGCQGQIKEIDKEENQILQVPEGKGNPRLN